MKTTAVSIVVTSCTGRKLHPSGVALSDISASFSSIHALVATWRKALLAAGPRYVAGTLYGGRSFREAESVANSLEAPLYVVSAGLGLTSVQEPVPAYDLTVSGTGSTVLPILRELGLAPSHWWAALNEGLGKPAPIASLLRSQPKAIVYLAMPSTYLSLVGDELAALSKSDRARLRIFSSPAWQRAAPAALAKLALPYDERLETTAYAGTRNDFPQRALRHFIQALQGNALTLSEGRSAVEAVMARHTLRVLPERQKRTDDEVRALLKRHWKANNGAGDRLLRVLRDELLIKCEQSRFRHLWQSVRAEMERS
ncbi:hypothetical protein [Roseateles puraquae]|uniref:hypothetical protein n=2 Tax=Pseudomonadota TaxID=1224 RepID=UPI0013030048|nr:hypothetical protein [Roseateles puraquae]MDG0857487.1 hypothetical protein [Roseateles puraquae]